MIVCCGEALIDMLPRQDSDGSPIIKPVAGGALLNTSVALRRLEIPSGLYCGLSSDLFGDLLREWLDGSQVDHSFCPKLDLPTTLAFIRLVDGHAQYAFYDENSAMRMTTTKYLPKLDSNVSCLHFGGISLIGEPCGSTFETLMTLQRGKRVLSFDPNIRTGFITDEPSYRARVQRMLSMADIIKLSDEDLEWITGSQDFDAIAGQWLVDGATIVIVTKGAEGLVGYTDKHRVEQKPFTAQVVDTVGAGDTVNAGMLAYLQREGLMSLDAIGNLSQDQLQAMLALGGGAASVTVSRAGANPPRLDELPQGSLL